GKKEFIQQIKTASIINSADLDVNGTTTLVDININGNCVIGDQSSDTLTVNCTNPVFTDSVTILGVSSLENVNVQNLNVAQSLYFNSQSETPLEFVWLMMRL